MIRPVPVATRNGYPETRPYVYRGKQHDAFRPQAPAASRRARYAEKRDQGCDPADAAALVGICGERTVRDYEAFYQAGREHQA